MYRLLPQRLRLVLRARASMKWDQARSSIDFANDVVALRRLQHCTILESSIRTPERREVRIFTCAQHDIESEPIVVIQMNDLCDQNEPLYC